MSCLPAYAGVSSRFGHISGTTSFGHYLVNCWPLAAADRGFWPAAGMWATIGSGRERSRHRERVRRLDAPDPVGGGRRDGGEAVSTFRPNVQTIAVSGCCDGKVRVWDLDSGELVCQPLGHRRGFVHAVAVGVLHGRPIAVSGGGDAGCGIWSRERCWVVRWRGTVASGHPWVVVRFPVLGWDLLTGLRPSPTSGVVGGRVGWVWAVWVGGAPAGGI